MKQKKLIETIATIIRLEVQKEVKKLKKEIISEMQSGNAHANQESLIETVDNELNDNKTYSKNTSINDILTETARSYKGAPAESGKEEWPTMNNPLEGAVPKDGQPAQIDRASLAAKMGYGDVGGGLGANTGHKDLDKALNRDYRELVKRF